MSPSALHPVAQLADELKFYWSLLQTTVRLDRMWHANLEAQHDEAEADALAIGRCLAAGERAIDTLADLRELLVERIVATLPRMSALVWTTSLPARTRKVMRPAVDEVAQIVALLSSGVDVRNCRCTNVRVARYQLAQWLAGETQAKQLVDAASELTKLACSEAERRMAACISAFLVNCGKRPRARHELH